MCVHYYVVVICYFARIKMHEVCESQPPQLEIRLQVSVHYTSPFERGFLFLLYVCMCVCVYVFVWGVGEGEGCVGGVCLTVSFEYHRIFSIYLNLSRLGLFVLIRISIVCSVEIYQQIVTLDARIKQVKGSQLCAFLPIGHSVLLRWIQTSLF